MIRRREARAGTDAALVRRAAVRLGLQAAIGTAAVLAVLSTVTVVVLARNQELEDTTLLTETVARADDVNDPPTGTWLVIRIEDRTLASPGLPAGLPVTAALNRVGAGGAAEIADITAAGRDYRVRTELRAAPGEDPAVVQAVLDLQPGRNQLAALIRALVAGGLVGLALAAVAGTWFARRAVRPLEAALTLQRRFVADASHELRTPLTLLSTRAQLLRRTLRRGAEPDALQAGVDGLVVDADRLAAILDDLLVAVDPRGNTPDDETLDLAAVAAEVVAAATPSATAAQVRIAATGAGRVPVTGSAAGLRRAVTALVDNAVRHAATEVAVAVSATAGTAVVEVSDDGSGIEQAMLPRLFDRFASAGDRHGVPTGPRRYGLGLALVSEIVARHGGTVSAANRAGHGTVLRIELPRERR